MQHLTASRPAVPLSAALLASPLLQRGGFDVFEGLLDEQGVQSLLHEAQELLPSATESLCLVSKDVEGRGGHPARRFLSSAGGPVQDSLYQASWLMNFLHSVTGLEVQPTGERGTYTTYRPGDHLTLHKDVESCDLVLITCLQDTGLGGDHGALRLYPTRTHELLADIACTPQQGALDVHLRPGQTAVLYGGIVPHSVEAMGQAQQRVVSVLCYRVEA